MIVVKEFPDEVFESKSDLHKKLKAEKQTLKANKCKALKEADTFATVLSVSKVVDKGSIKERVTDKASKEEIIIESDNLQNVIEVKAVINSCMWFDSHRDVHINGCWDETVKDNEDFVHLQEHRAIFSHIISQDVRLAVEKFDINGRGVDALIIYSRIKRETNPFMYDKYLQGEVRHHSVGMRYIWERLKLAIDSNHEDDKEEKEVYDKYIDQIVNREEVEKYGYFWAVEQSEAIEGSAVVFGSNRKTPTISVIEVKNNDIEIKKEDSQKELLNLYNVILN